MGLILTKSPIFNPILTLADDFFSPLLLSSSKSFPLVGVVDATNPATNGPIRIFYPAASPSSPPTTPPDPASLYRVPYSYMLRGYLSMALSHLRASPYKAIAGLLVAFASTILPPLLPLAYAVLPSTSKNAPVAPGGPHPLLLWSHGLTGTGDEHGIMAVLLARRGYIVVIPQHTDGSSSLVLLKGGKDLPFVYPDYDDYDPDFREGQTRVRAVELFASGDVAVEVLGRENVRTSDVAVGGFSFGAATAARAICEQASLTDSEYNVKCAVLVDGWYNINLKKYGVDVNMPLSLHRRGLPPSVKSLFIGSEEFTTYSRLHEETRKIQQMCGDSAQTITMPGTRHGNFSDVVFWMPVALLKKARLVGTDVDPRDNYREQCRRIIDFLDDNIQQQ